MNYPQYRDLCRRCPVNHQRRHDHDRWNVRHLIRHQRGCLSRELPEGKEIRPHLRGRVMSGQVRWISWVERILIRI